jgi:hypothetical protein
VAAALPLWAAALTLIVPVPGPDGRWVLAAALAWTALLVAFSAGIRWGLALGPVGEADRLREFAAAAACVAMAAGVFFAAPAIGLALGLVAFLLQALRDVAIGDAGRVPVWWVRVRLMAAALLVVPVLALLVRVSLGG